MSSNRAPLIQAGQVFLHESLNEYIIVTINKRGQVYFEGNGVRGSCEDETFIERYPPVNPEDIDPVEVEYLLSLCPDGTEAAVGFIRE